MIGREPQAQRRAWVALDGVLAFFAAIMILILVTGGGEWRTPGFRVSARSIGNPALAWTVLALIRLRRLSVVPLFGLSRLSLERLGTRAGAILRAIVSDGGPLRARATLAATLILGGSLLLKLANAWFYPGFLTGDDVEIHEMTFKALFGGEWTIWNLRSPFYPMGVIYPVQAALFRLGVDDPRLLVFAGRTVVAVVSTLSAALLYRVAARYAGEAVALLALFFLAASGLHVAFGSTELPRPVAALFLVAAFGALLRGTDRGALLAGAALALAAAMRFGEAVFVLPALVHLLMAARRRHAVLVAAAFAVTALAVQAGVDAAYWDRPFASLAAIVDFTLVRGLSTRGYQPPWYYAQYLHTWTTVVMAGLAVYATRAHARLAVWVWLPILVLSLLPHQEVRYLVPVLPFLALLAACGVVQAVRALEAARAAGSRRVHVRALLLLLALVMSTLLEADRYRLRRPGDDVALAGALNASGVDSLAVQALWRFGGRIYLTSVPRLEDLPEDALGSGDRFAGVVRDLDVSALAVVASDCERIACGEVLDRAGYVLSPLVTARYRTFVRRKR